MKVETTNIPGLLMIKPEVFSDERGFFLEDYQRDRYVEAGITADFIQDNHSHNRRDVLRGLHFTIKTPQVQLVYVSSGEIFDVAVDLRAKSPSFGCWHGVHLSAEAPCQVFIPAGFAHGFCGMDNDNLVFYGLTNYRSKKDEVGILWNDKTLKIKWPTKKPIISSKDKNNITFEKYKNLYL